MATAGSQSAILPRYYSVPIFPRSASSDVFLEPERNPFLTSVLPKSDIYWDLKVTSHDRIRVSTGYFDAPFCSIFNLAQSDELPDLPPWLKRESAPNVQVLTTEERERFELYPAFGKVVEVDWSRERVCVELMEANLSGLIALPFTKQTIDNATIDLVPNWMRQEGQLFEAWATLAERDPQQFYIGDFELVEEVSPEDIVEELRRRAVSTHEVRF